MTIADSFIDTFEPFIARVLTAVRRAERFLGPDDDWVEDDRRIVYEAAQRVLGPLGRDTVSRVLADDYVTTVHADSDVVEEVLHNNGYQRNLLSTRKYREHHDGGRQWAVGSWVLDPADEAWQQHVILYEAPNGDTDLYSHEEASVRSPAEHDGGDSLIHGDPEHRVRSALDGRVAFASRNL